jgi:hypothetical protein
MNKITELTVDCTEIIGQVGSRSGFELSDEIKVNLNYYSRIKYPWNLTRNIGKTRMYVEAFNADKPFIRYINKETTLIKYNQNGTFQNKK